MKDHISRGATVISVLCCWLIAGCNPNPHLCVDGVTTESLNGLTYNAELNDSDVNIVNVHGGAWRYGDSNESWIYNRSIDAIDRLENFNVYSLNYTLWNPVRNTGNFPTQQNEVIAFLESLPEGQITCLVGHSAGAHIVSTVVATRPDLVDCSVQIAGIYDFNAFDQSHTEAVRAAIADYRDGALQDLSIASLYDPNKLIPPTLLAVGQWDGIVDRRQTFNEYDRLTELGADVSITTASNIGHGLRVYGECGNPLTSETTDSVLSFLESFL